MKYKLVAIDLDGTLIGKDHQLSPEIKTLIESAMQMGVFFTLATGRVFRSAATFAQQLGLATPIIASNGAVVKNLTARVYEHLKIPSALAAEVINLVQAEQAVRYVYFGDDIFTDNLEHPFTQRYSKSLGVEIFYAHDLIKVINSDPTMIVVRVETGRTAELTLQLRSYFGPKLYITNSSPYFVEILNPSVSKGRALAKVAGELGIKQEEIIAIGDSYNDLEMIKYAGLGVIVGNAEEIVKKEADYVTEEPGAKGVAEVIRKFILV